MKSLFNFNNPFMQFMEKIANLIILNILFLLCSIPIITIGPALSALFYVSFKMWDDQESSIIATFFTSFMQNLKQGSFMTLICFGITFFLLADLRLTWLFLQQTALPTFLFLFYFIIFAMVILLAVIIYSFALLARFDNTIRHTFQNALFLSLRNLPRTILILFYLILPVILFFSIKEQLGIFILLFWTFGISLVVFLQASVFRKIFINYSR